MFIRKILFYRICILTGFDTDGLMTAVWRGGESEALTRLERHLERKAWVASFGRPKMTPQSLLASQTGLSPYLRFGCLSVRLFHQQLTNLYKKVVLCSLFLRNCWNIINFWLQNRSRKPSRRCRCTAKSSGANSSTAPPPTIRISTGWSAIPSASRFHGTLTQKLWPNGPM